LNFISTKDVEVLTPVLVHAILFGNRVFSDGHGKNEINGVAHNADIWTF
jgi:hypothetical protein